jgi:(4S)-4-hydroxy-5-phosphonooxypentane-2,3-dione isomerase
MFLRLLFCFHTTRFFYTIARRGGAKMIVRGITVYVKSESVGAFREATLDNRAGSILEPGILRFDVLQSDEDETVFYLYEVYRDEAAATAHKTTAHYKKWKETVEPMMAAPREGKAFTPIAPEDPSEW